MLTDLAANVSIGLSTALSLDNLLYCFIGVTLGTVLGVIPGIGTLAAMSMLFPVTFYLDPIPALVMLGGIYYGTTYGGSTASILLNLPGSPSNAVTCLDGYPMARQGRAGVALFMTTVASFFGAGIGILLMMLFSPSIARLALSFGPAEYFSLMVMGLIAASVISTGSALKAIAMVVLGILIGLIGIDINSAVPRFTFGVIELMDGINLVALAMALFGVAEVIASIRKIETGNIEKRINLRSMLPTRSDMRQSWLPMIRGTSVGAFFGVLPGVGGTVASFVAYAVEKKTAKDPSRFGKGAIEGIMGPESANNAADQTSFIPTLTLGVPGTASMALILGILMIHGITPGPRLLTENREMFWGLVMSFWIGNILLVILNVPLIGIWVRLLMIPYHILYPAILMFVCIGVFIVNNNTFDLMVLIVLALLGYGMRLLDFPAAPLLLGYVLGPMMEEHLRRALLLSRGSFEIFYTRPLSLMFMTISVGLLAWGAWSAYRSARARAAARRPSETAPQQTNQG